MEESLGESVWWENTTTMVGSTPNSVMPINQKFVNAAIASRQPTAIVAMGRQALEAIESSPWHGPLLVLPHPTYRLLTNSLLKAGGALLRTGFTGTIELRQSWKKPAMEMSR